MVDACGAGQRNCDLEIKRLGARSDVLKRRLQAAEASARAAISSRDVAMAFAREPIPAVDTLTDTLTGGHGQPWRIPAEAKVGNSLSKRHRWMRVDGLSPDS
jgi:hypothetical protein